MTFLNPWGLLALLAIPVILALHFFRQQKKSRLVGGLHLWDFARIATPAGKRFEKLIASLPLLFQLLAALVLALLLAGLDIPMQSSARHYSIIVDDSVSMQARVGGAVSAQRARQGIAGWAKDGDRFTLVAASGRPAVLAGPAATRQEMLAALEGWVPSSPVANLDEAVNIATKFGSEDSRILLLTDNPESAGHLKDSVTLWGVGKRAPNTAIVFADRMKTAADKERVVATVQAFGGAPGSAELTAYHNDVAVATRALDIQSTAPVLIEMELPATPDPIRLSLSPEDSLAADDTVILVPAPSKPVRVYLPDDLPQREFFLKAVTSARETLLAPNPAEADLAFTAGNPSGALAGVRRVYAVATGETTAGQRYATGRDIVSAPESALTRNLVLAGVVWPFDGSAQMDARTALRADLSYTSIPLLYADRETSASVRYRMNIALNSTNIFRHTAWPVLVLNMIEECRSALPGLARTNLRAGEDLLMNLQLKEGPQVVSLWREGEKALRQRWDDAPPRVLTELVPGTYLLRQGAEAESPLLERFRVNLFSQGESDLQPLNEVEPDLKTLEAGELENTQRNMMLFYGLLLAMAICILLAWLYHDAGH